MAGLNDVDHDIITRFKNQLHELSSTEDDLRREKGELENRLNGINRSIVDARRAVDAKRSELHGYYNRLSPILSLPPEILSLIFYDVVGFRVDHGHTMSPVYPTPPMLALVCQTWRRVVLGDPKLWTHLNLRLFLRHWYYPQSYLSRSARLPLDVSLPPSKSPHTLDLTWCQSFREAERWRRIWMDLSPFSRENIHPLLSQKRAESLTYVCLVDRRKRRHHVRPAFAHHQFNLHTLILIRTPMPEVLIAPHLQHLVFAGAWKECPPELIVSYRDLRQLLISTKNLQTLGIGVQSVAFGDWDIVEPTLLPHLRHLTLYFYESDLDTALSDLLDMVSAPALQTIELTAEYETCDTYDPYAYTVFVVDGIPRYPTVTTAILYHVIYQDLDAEQLIEAFPDIKSLTINSFSVPHLNSAIQELDCPDSSSDEPWAWASLEHLRVYVPHDFMVDFEESDCWELCNLLDHREEQGLPLLKLDLVMDQIPPDSAEEWLDAWDALGSVSLLTIVDAFEDTADAPWKFWVNYGQLACSASI